MNIYCIPGLGFDERIFKNLKLNAQAIHYLNWIEPYAQEKIKAYSKRLSKSILTTNNILIGHSFGGIISLEIANLIPIKQIFLVSSIQNPNEIPLSFKVLTKLRIDKTVSPKMFSSTIPIWGRFYDYKTKEEIALVKNMIYKTSPNYFTWALHTITNWSSNFEFETTKIYQIHGDADKTFPIQKIKNPDLIIKKAGHFMVYKHADKISQFINNNLI